MSETFDKCSNCGFYPAYKIDELIDQSVFWRCKCNGGFAKNLKDAIEVWNEINGKLPSIWTARIIKSGFHPQHSPHHISLLIEVLNNRKIRYSYEVEEGSITIELYRLGEPEIRKIIKEVINVIFGDAGTVLISIS